MFILHNSIAQQKIDTSIIKADIVNIMTGKHTYEKAVVYKKHGRLIDSTTFYYNAYKTAIGKLKNNANKQDYIAYIDNCLVFDKSTLKKRFLEYSYVDPLNSLNVLDNVINFHDYLKILKYCFFDNNIDVLPAINTVREILYVPEAGQVEVLRKNLINIVYLKFKYEKSVLSRLSDTSILKKAYHISILQVKEKNKRNEYLQVIENEMKGSEKGISVLPYRYLQGDSGYALDATTVSYEDYFIGIKYYFFDNNFSELPTFEEFIKMVAILKKEI